MWSFNGHRICYKQRLGAALVERVEMKLVRKWVARISGESVKSGGHSVALIVDNEEGSGVEEKKD